MIKKKIKEYIKKVSEEIKKEEKLFEKIKKILNIGGLIIFVLFGLLGTYFIKSLKGELGLFLFMIFISLGMISLIYFVLHKFVDALNKGDYLIAIIYYITVMAAFTFAFAFIYSYFNVSEQGCLSLVIDPKNGINSSLDNIYFSGVTLSTLGYGDIIPKSYECKIISLIETFIGLSINVVFIALCLTKIKKEIICDKCKKEIKFST